MTVSKKEFLDAYQEELQRSFAWTEDSEKLSKFMQSVERTICSNADTWNHDSPIAKKVYQRLTGKKDYSRKALRALGE